MSPIKISIIGHCCMDVTDTGYVLGGAVSYMSKILHHHRCDLNIFTSWGKDFLFASEIAMLGKLHITKSNETTIFKNAYAGDQRTQFLLSRANSIHMDKVRESLSDSDLIIYAPLADEIDPDGILKDSSALQIGLLQGFLRSWGKGGKIYPKDEVPSFFKGLDIIILSEEDLPDYKTYLPKWIVHTPIIIITKGKGGITFYKGKEEWHFPSFPSIPIDPTGAGDSFSAGFILRYMTGHSLKNSIQWGQAMASLCIEQDGMYLPTEGEILKRMEGL